MQGGKEEERGPGGSGAKKPTGKAAQASSPANTLLAVIEYVP